jgi:hypothetical protein
VAEILGGGSLIGALTVGGAVAFYYAELPAHPGPSNASPPPEALGMMLGAFLGTALGGGAVAVIARSMATAIRSFLLAMLVGAAYWLVMGSDSFGDRIAVVSFAGFLCGAGAALGLVLAALANALHTRGHDRG